MESKCSAFWKHTNIRSDNRIFPCCRFKSPIGELTGDLNEVLYLPEYNNLREKSLAGQYIEECSKCYHEEAIGKKSLRQHFNEEYQIDDIKLEYLEIGLDNICNLTCDGCWEEFSSAWAKEKYPDEKTIWVKSTKDIYSVPDTVKKILFLGGEPLMSKRHVKFLQLISNPTDVEVVYNTNGTFLLDDYCTKILNNFKQVSFILSIDGYGELNDLVRNGSKWDEILLFIEQIKRLGFGLSINSVIHMNNWQGVKELEAFVQEINVPWTVNFLTYPTHLDIVNVIEKENLIDMLRSVKLVNLEYIVNHVKGH